MRAGRQLHLIIMAVFVVSAFLFLQSSWSNVVYVRTVPVGGIGTNDEAVTPEDAVVEHTGKNNGKTVVLDDPAPARVAKHNEQPMSIGKPQSLHTVSSVIAPSATSSPTSTTTPAPDRIVVIGRLHSEDTTWVQNELPDWQHAIYIVDEPSSPHLHTSMNKGRESMPYLTYLIDNYHKLPSTIVFLHAHRGGYPLAWHNEGGDNYDAVEMLRTLDIDYVQRTGYANLRCIHIPGCMDEIQPFRSPKEDHRTAEHVFADAWYQMFNNTKVPNVVGTPCCAQFAVSREQVLKRPLADYQRYRDWLIHTPLTDDVSGRVFEYLWHIIFGREAVHCPAYEQCSCDVYNRCVH